MIFFYFIKCQSDFTGDEIVYLDPHTTQLAGNIDDLEEQAALDESYHCPFPGRMKMTRLDPSVAVVSLGSCVLCSIPPPFFPLFIWNCGESGNKSAFICGVWKLLFVTFMAPIGVMNLGTFAPLCHF